MRKKSGFGSMNEAPMEPYSCDTFVALPSVTKYGAVIFGKNSDRPSSEIQEVVRFPAQTYEEGAKLQCTYIAIPQASRTHAVILSKPAWMWGAEMGANEHGVCIGNEAVSTRMESAGDLEERLLGMDLVRLGLERSSSASEAVTVISGLLEQFGQGGACTDDKDNPRSYHNSFIIADPSEAWVLETAGRHWVAENVPDGVRNISNQLSVETNIDQKSKGLEITCKVNGWWDGKEKFNFAKAMAATMPSSMFSADEAPAKRFSAGKSLMEQEAQNDEFSIESMFRILRDQDSCICRVGTGPRNIASTGSQVSVVFPTSSQQPSFHWFTCSPNPMCSSYKPFTFLDQESTCQNTTSPTFEKDPAKHRPRFQTTVDRSHAFHMSHSKIRPLPGDSANQSKLATSRQLERDNITRVEALMHGQGEKAFIQGWFDRAVKEEMDLYDA